MKQPILIIGISIIVFLAVTFLIVGMRFSQNEPKATTLTYWGFWDEQTIKPILQSYNQKTGVKINYVQQSPLNYGSRIQTQIREGQGPDIFQIHNSWIDLFNGYLSPAPSNIYSTNTIKSDFYPIVSDSFIRGNSVLAVPANIDGLALYYNEEILSAAGVSVPRTWQQMIEASNKLTVKDEVGQIKTAGIALGATNNIDYWPDILGLLLLQQPGVDLSLTQTQSAEEVIKFYTSFVVDPRRKSWDQNLPSSFDMFSSGRLAFYLAPYSSASKIKQANPSLKFKTAPTPQLPGKSVAWASFWGETVSVRSKFPEQSWDFIKYMTSFQQAAQLGGVPATITLGKTLEKDPVIGAYVLQGGVYKYWYLQSNTFDNGINDEMISEWKKAIDGVLSGQNTTSVLTNIAPSVKEILAKYLKTTQ